MAIEIKLRSFRGAPVGADLRELADNQRLDVRLLGLFIVEVSANVSNVGIGQADDLPGVTWVGEYFLISGEAGIKNDFAAPARDRAGRAAIKYAPVFQRENRRSMRNFRQCVLPNASADIVRSFRFRFRGRGHRKRTEVIDRPIREHSFAVDKSSRHRPENPRVIRACAMIPQHKVLALGNARRRVRSKILGFRRNVRLRQMLSVDEDSPLLDFYRILRQSHDALDE